MKNFLACKELKIQCFLYFVTGSDNDLVLRQILHEPVFDGETLLHRASKVRPSLMAIKHFSCSTQLCMKFIPLIRGLFKYESK